MCRGGTVSLRATWAVSALLALALTPLGGQTHQGQDEISRKAKSKVNAIYPELARKMNLTGTVKVEVVVLPNGTVKGARVVGGHPVLANAALDAVKKWRFEPASMASNGIVV